MSIHALPAFQFRPFAGRKVTHVAMPRIVEEELSLGSWAMPFMAISAVVLYLFEPGASSALLLSTFGIAVYTTSQPETKAWAEYNAALSLPLGERVALLQKAHNLAPHNDQIILAMAVSLLEAGKHTEAITLLRQLGSRHPNDAAVESALNQASRTMLQQAAAQGARSVQ